MRIRYITLALLSLALGCNAPITQEIPSPTIPTIDQVGVQAMPDSIAPIIAPFEMPELKRPKFPDLSVSILEKGAKRNTKVTAQIQTAIDEVNAQGGGTVIVPAGTWQSGRISLKSNVNLHFEEGAEIQFSGNLEDYRPAVFTRIEGIEVMSLGACIYANGQENIAITGKGKLIGPAEGPVRDKIMTHELIENVVDLNAPVSQRIHDGTREDWHFAPMFISPINCKNVFIEGVSLEHTAFWNIVPIYCDGVIIRGISVQSVGIPRGDGIDVESSRNVLIEYSTLSSGDDCFTMKAGRGEDGLRVNKPTENVVVRHCLAREGHGGITCGSETAGMIRNLYVHDCVFDNTGVGIRFKTRRPRGGGGENLYYERIRMNLRYTIFKWDMLGSAGSVGELANRLPMREVNKLTPQYKNIFAKDLIVENGDHFVKIYGIPESPLQNLVIEGAQVNCKQLFIFEDVDGLTIRNSTIKSTQDSLIVLTDARNIVFDNVNFQVPGEQIYTEIKGVLTENIRFENTSPEKPARWGTTRWR